MHQLVTRDVIVLRVIARERHDDAIAERLREAARPFADQPAGDVRLLKVGVVREVDDRLLLAELVLQHRREPRVPALEHSRRVGHRQGFDGIEVDVELRRLENPEVEGLVLHLVPAEVLCVGGRGSQCRPDGGDQDGQQRGWDQPKAE